MKHQRKSKVLRYATICAFSLQAAPFLMANNTFAINYPIPDGYTTFVDENLYDCVAQDFQAEFPTEDIPDTGLTDEQLSGITSVSCVNKNISDTTGIEKLIGVTDLTLFEDNLTSIDLSQNTALTRLTIWVNNLNSLDLSHNTALKNLSAHTNQLTSINLSHNIVLETLDIGGNQLTSLDLSKNTALKRLEVDNNQLTALNLTENTALEYLEVDNNQLISLILPATNTLGTISAYNNQLTSIDLSKNPSLTVLRLANNKITSIDLTHNPALTAAHIANNDFLSIDLSKNTDLQYLTIDDDAMIIADIPSRVEDGKHIYDLSGLKYVTEQYVVQDTEYVSYDQDTKLLTVLDADKIDNYVYLVNPSSSAANTYKIQLFSKNEPEETPDDDENILTPNTGSTTKNDDSMFALLPILPISIILVSLVVIAHFVLTKKHINFN